jgi:hypothetical protein
MVGVPDVVDRCSRRYAEGVVMEIPMRVCSVLSRLLLHTGSRF